MRLILLMLFVLPLASCVTYRNDDDGIGKFQNLQGVRQMQGTYRNVAIDHGALAKPDAYGNQLATSFMSSSDEVIFNRLPAPGYFRITYVSEQQLLLEFFDAAGQPITTKHITSPQDFTFRDGALYRPTQTIGSSRNVEKKGEITRSYHLNEKGNLVMKRDRSSLGNVLIIPQMSHTRDYFEFQRVQ